MIDPKNIVSLTGGVVADPRIDGSVVTLRLAADWAGSEKDAEDRSGYFTVKYFTSTPDRNVEFVKRQLEAGNFKKGTQLQIVGRLQQERWRDKESGDPRQQVVIVAEAITYAGRRPTDDEAKTPEASSPVPGSF